MGLLKIFNLDKHNVGFTLIEVSVVIVILIILVGLGLFLSMDSWLRGMFCNDRDMVVSALQRARSLAVNNMCFGTGCTEGKQHGVHFDPAKREVVIFQGEAYSDADPNNEIIPFDSHTVYIVGSSTVDIVFDRISGNVATSTNVTLKDDGGHSSVITVNSEGRIDF